ncbi:hypothetical protein FACS1894202_00700 [Clostridia bacterium]|nr:hypothetical protein FACS1894202_00700 [Clostridia bacterium]
MSQETSVLLRSLLFQMEKAETLDDAKDAVRIMCDKDDIAAVEQQISAAKKRKAEAQ